MPILRWIIDQAVQQAAHQKLHEAAANALQGETEPQPIPPLADIVLCFSLAAEAVGVLDRVKQPILEQWQTPLGTIDITHGQFAGANVAVAVVGSGKEAAEQATAAIMAGRIPKWLISAGFAMGLKPELGRRSFLLASEVVAAGESRHAMNLFLDPASLASLKNVHVGPLLSLPQPPKTAAEKQRWSEEQQAVACDIDSFFLFRDVPRNEFVAETPTAIPLPRCLSVRIISDGIDDELSPEMEAMMKQESWGAKLGAAAGALFRRPSVAKELWDWQNESLLLADRLAKFLAGIVPQLK